MASQKPEDGVTYLLLPPDGGYGWVVASAGFIAMFLGEGTMYSFGLYMAEISEDLETTEKVIALANSTMSGFYFVFGPIMCALVNRFGYRVIGVLGGVIAGAAFFGASYLQEPISFIFVFGAIGGIGFSMLYFASILVVAVYFERWRGVAISLALCGGTAGSMAIPQIILVAFKGYNWRQQFQYFAALAVLCGCVTLLYKPLQPFEIKAPESRKPTVPTGKDDDISEFLQLYSVKSEESFVSLKPTRSAKSARSGKSSLKSRVSLDRQSIRIRAASMRSHPRKLSFKRQCRDFWTCRCCDCDTCGLNCCELCCCCVIERRCCIFRGKPMNRQDILYAASVNVIPEHKKSATSRMGMLEYHLSVTNITPTLEVRKEMKVCLCCPRSITRTLRTMLDVSVTKIPSFNLVMLNSFLITMAYYSPPIYITQKAKDEGVPEQIANLMISIFGASALLGRIMCIVLSSFPQVDTLAAICVSSLFCGICILTDNVSPHYINHIVSMVTFGICGSICYSLRTPMIVQLYGLESLSSSFGLCMMGYGLAGFVGVPLSALIYDSTENYTAIFYYIGSVATLSGIVIFPVMCMRPKEVAKEEARKSGPSQPATTEQSKKGEKKAAKKKRTRFKA